ncbi:MAG: hypothetical protein SynsKO_04110 [Synoicihabitans sp.]
MTTLAHRLSSILPGDRILSRPADRAAYDSDAQTAYRCRAAAVIIPQDPAELVKAVQWCVHEAVPFVLRGSGTGLSAAATPVEEGVVIVTTALNRIRQLDPVKRTAVVEAGVVNADISRAAAVHGLFFAPDPSSQPICTIGGNIGFNAGGAHCLKHGMTSNHVLGVKAILANGEVVSWGQGRRDHVGPDWTGLFVGNEGLFGALIEATVNLLPCPDGCHTVLAGFSSADAAGDAVSAIIASGLVPVAMELMDDLTIEAVRPVVPINYPPNCHALLLVELDGPAQVVAAERRQLESLLRDQGSTGLVIASDAQERANIWRVRKSAYSAYGRFAPNNFVQDSVVPRRHLGEALRRIKTISAQAGLKCPNVCHAGDGNLHPNLLYDGEVPGEFDKAERAAGEILRMSVELGGSITGEHGVGLEKRSFMPLMYGADELNLFRQIHHAFDPSAISNPGKCLPAEHHSQRTHRAYDHRITAVAKQVGERDRISPIGAGTKHVLEAETDHATLSTQSLQEIVDYEPAEFVLTALAGTPLKDVVETLAAQGQQLLFDPPFMSQGATLGGTIASGLNGPGSWGGGRIRDAMLGATLIDGKGTILTVGSRVVKNVAGFDIPKLLVGSGGALGLTAEVTLKVRPIAAESETWMFETKNRTQFFDQLAQLNSVSIRPVAIEADPAHSVIYARFEGPAGVVEELTRDLTASGSRLRDPMETDRIWTDFRDLCWADASTGLVKIPVGLDRVREAMDLVSSADQTTSCRIAQGGEVLWLAADAPALEPVRTALAEAGFSSLALRGVGPRIVSGNTRARVCEQIKRVFDPEGKFPPLD